MVNCCILRRKQNAPQNGNVGDHTIKPVQRVGNLFDQVSKDKAPRTSKFQTLLERFVEGGADTNNSEAIEVGLKKKRAWSFGWIR